MSVLTQQHTNGVATARLFAAIDAARGQPAAAQFQFRVVNAFEAARDADLATPTSLVEQSRTRSAVFDVMTAGTEVSVHMVPGGPGTDGDGAS